MNPTSITQEEFNRVEKELRFSKLSPEDLKKMYEKYNVSIPAEIGEIKESNLKSAKEELWWALRARVPAVEVERLKFKSIPFTKSEAIELTETVKERGITVREVQELMKKLSMPDYSKVNAKNKMRYTEMILKRLNDAFQCESLKRAIIEIKEESFHRCGNEEIITSRKKSKIQSKDLVPSTNIHNLAKKYVERQTKKLV